MSIHEGSAVQIEPNRLMQIPSGMSGHFRIRGFTLSYPVFENTPEIIVGNQSVAYGRYNTQVLKVGWLVKNDTILWIVCDVVIRGPTHSVDVSQFFFVRGVVGVGFIVDFPVEEPCVFVEKRRHYGVNPGNGGIEGLIFHDFVK